MSMAYLGWSSAAGLRWPCSYQEVQSRVQEWWRQSANQSTTCLDYTSPSIRLGIGEDLLCENKTNELGVQET